MPLSSSSGEGLRSPSSHSHCEHQRGRVSAYGPPPTSTPRRGLQGCPDGQGPWQQGQPSPAVPADAGAAAQGTAATLQPKCTPAPCHGKRPGRDLVQERLKPRPTLPSWAAWAGLSLLPKGPTVTPAPPWALRQQWARVHRVSV